MLRDLLSGHGLGGRLSRLTARDDGAVGELLLAGAGETLRPVAWPLVTTKGVDKSTEVDLPGR